MVAGVAHRVCVMLVAMAALSAAARAASDDLPVDVCPANSVQKSLPFLKAIKPHALAALLGDSGSLSINMAAVTDFIKTTLVPLIGANVFFFALAVVMLVIFIICCDLKRAKNDPGEILFGHRMKVNKGFMFVFGLTAIALAAYGMITTNKNITDGAFNVLASIMAYLNRAFATLDGLLDTISGTSDIITKFQQVVTLDIEVDAVVTNMTAIATFLDNAPAPTVLLASVTVLLARVDPDLKIAITDLGTATTAFGAYSWNSAFGRIKDAGPSGIDVIGSMSTRAGNLQAAINALGGPPPTNGQADTLKAAVDAMFTDMQASSWVTGAGALDDIADALLNGVGANNPFAALRSKVQAVRTIVTDIKTTKTDNLINIINALVGNYTLVEPAMAGLLRKMAFINATILVLPPAMQDAYTKLTDAKTNLDTVMFTPPTPTDLTANVTSFRDALPDVTPLNNLITSLTTAETALFTAFPATTTADYLAWIAVVKAAVNGVVGVSIAGGPLGQLQAAVTTYITGGYTTWGPVPAKIAALPIGALTGATAFGDATAIARVAAYSLTANSAVAPLVPGGTAAATSYVAAATTEINKGSLTGLSASFTASMADVNTAYAALGPTPSVIVNQPKQMLQDIKTAALTNGDAVKAQVAQTVASFRGSTGSIKDMVVTQLGDIRDRFQGPAQVYDSYRYTASMVLYAVGILFVALVLSACLANFQFGANVTTLLLFIITILYFLLALLIALLVSALAMGCNELEPLALRFAPARMTPLLRYYFYNEGVSVEAVLRDASLVDIGAVRTQITSSKDDVLQGLTGTFTWVDNPSNPRNPYRLIGRINTTIDTALTQADDLLVLANRTKLFGVYSEVKGYVCCGVPDMVSPMWTSLTFAGIFALAMLFATMWFIGKLDRVPRRDCCGCSCHTRAKYAGTVCPGETDAAEALPQYNTQPGWENAMGPYAVPPNGAMAMHAPWQQLDGPVVSISVSAPGGGHHKAK